MTGLRPAYAPAYYASFRCLASACPDSCCQGWEVDVDLPTARRYLALPGPLGDRLREVLRVEGDAAQMTLTEGCCPMWQADGLCRIQAQLGEDKLCRVCREFPRLRHDYGDFVELGLELSCPEAARLILTSPPEPVTCQSVPGREAPEYDGQAMALLRGSRENALALLAGPSPERALARLLRYAMQVQAQLDGGLEGGVPEALPGGERFPAMPGAMEDIFAFFRGLEILTPRWRARLAKKPECVPLPPQTFPLARYFVERYWLQAVSDYDLLGRVQFAVTACLLIGALGGDFLETAQLFSKEIENDPDNMDALLDAAYGGPALSPGRLLGLLDPA